MRMHLASTSHVRCSSSGDEKYSFRKEADSWIFTSDFKNIRDQTRSFLKLGISRTEGLNVLCPWVLMDYCINRFFCLNSSGGGQNVCRPKKYPCNSCISLKVYSTLSTWNWAMAGGRSLVVSSVLSTSLIFAAAIEINQWHEISVWDMCGKINYVELSFFIKLVFVCTKFTFYLCS